MERLHDSHFGRRFVPVAAEQNNNNMPPNEKHLIV